MIMEVLSDISIILLIATVIIETIMNDKTNKIMEGIK